MSIGAWSPAIVVVLVMGCASNDGAGGGTSAGMSSGGAGGVGTSFAGSNSISSGGASGGRYAGSTGGDAAIHAACAAEAENRLNDCLENDEICYCRGGSMPDTDPRLIVQTCSTESIGCCGYDAACRYNYDWPECTCLTEAGIASTLALGLVPPDPGNSDCEAALSISFPEGYQRIVSCPDGMIVDF
ncbi:MAG TPA: hypothetical protein VHO25_00675 [Polyangiaceae bacterium]|nr:hypothetical protein [Polyangiaceae bacterium]